MRSRRSHQDEVTEVARRRLELLSAELAEIRPASADLPGEGPTPGGRAGPGEPSTAGYVEPWAVPVGGLDDGLNGGLDGGFDGELDDELDDEFGGQSGRSGPSGRSGQSGPSGGGGAGPEGRAAGPGRHAHRPLGPVDSALGWLHDRLPPTLQGNGQLGGGHLAVLVVVLALAVAGTAWWLSRADGGSQLPAVASHPSALVSMTGAPAGAPAGGATSAGAPAGGATSAGAPAGAPGQVSSGPVAPSGGPTPTSAASPTGQLVVDVAGKVRRPGIATLPVGSRVVDALEAAGGARRGVPLGTLNLARQLTDGEQIVVGLPAAPGVAASAASAPGSSGTGTPGGAVPVVNINSASQIELEGLPGVGPVTAQSILAFRTEHGTFTSVDELLEVSGIGDATLAKIAPFVTL